MSGEDLVGRLIAGGRYEIVRLLGEGGMGCVYQARQVAMDRMVALKLILPEVVRSPAAAARFHREMKLTAKVEHPNTIRVYDFGEAEGRLFLTMELVRGRTLTEVLKETGRLPLDRLVRIATQVARALGAAHAEGVVHRDLKPDNVMLLEQYGERDVVKVLDFGVAKSLDEHEARMTAAGAVIGTPAYMSAEQAMGAPVDPRSDLYSLGIMLFEMASGRVPFTAPALTALLVAHATEPPPPLAQIAPDVHPGLAALVEELLRKDPAARPQSAREVEARLAALIGAPTASLIPGAAPALPPPPVSPVRPVGPTFAVPGLGAPAAPKRSRAGWFALLVVLVVGGGIAAAVIAQGGSGGSAIGSSGSGSQAGGSQAAPGSGSAVATPSDAGSHPGDAAGAGPSDVAGRLARARDQLAGFGDPAPPDACPPDAAADAAELVLAARRAIGDAPDQAIADADQAIAKCPSLAAAYNVRGNALQKLARLEDASDAYARALQFAPDYAAPRFNLGIVQLRRRDPAAIATFSDILRRKPDDADAYKSRAQAYVNAARFAEAAADLEAALARAPQDGPAWMMLGAVRARARHGDARAAYCKAAALGVADAAARCKPR